MTAQPVRYSSALITVHWLTVLVIAAAYAFIELRGIFPDKTPAHAFMKAAHYSLGLIVWLLVLARIPIRYVSPVPPITPPPPAWQLRLAHGLHWVLYAFLLVMPLLGWLTLSAKGQVIPFWGVDLPPLLSPDKVLGKDLQDVHELIGHIGYGLIGLHAAAALFHHYVLRDDTLRRMGWRP